MTCAPFAAQAATKALSRTDDVIRSFDALTSAERTQVTDAMKLYEQQVGDVTWHL
jgi:hypothetical protein